MSACRSRYGFWIGCSSRWNGICVWVNLEFKRAIMVPLTSLFFYAVLLKFLVEIHCLWVFLEAFLRVEGICEATAPPSPPPPPPLPPPPPPPPPLQLPPYSQGMTLTFCLSGLSCTKYLGTRVFPALSFRQHYVIWRLSSPSRNPKSAARGENGYQGLL